MSIGIVVIGRNEGERLRRCLSSVQNAKVVVYVDSGSTDDSVKLARSFGAEVVELAQDVPFTASRARNAGFKRLKEIAPGSMFAQFVDGDCELVPHWLDVASRYLKENTRVGAVCGRLRERHPENSIYNWLCDREWNGPLGEIRACGGILMMRTEAFASIEGYRADLIAGEDDEICFRLRSAGWIVWRLDQEMGYHDAAMTRFSQWWKRAMRTGYAFALGAQLHGSKPDRFFVWESARAVLWGIGLPLFIVAATVTFPSSGWVTILIFPIQFIRQCVRQTGTLRDRSRVAFFHLLGRFPESWGQIKFLGDRLFGRRQNIIEYK
jgi:GT2 family glycosyltransferase